VGSIRRDFVPITDPPDETAEAIIAEARQKVVEPPIPFSPNAFSLLREKVEEYIRQLVSESIRVSSRHKADLVSAAYVETASEYLVSSSARRFYRHIGTIGGILLGASVENIIGISLEGKVTILGAILAASLGILGAFLVALHMARD